MIAICRNMDGTSSLLRKIYYRLVILCVSLVLHNLSASAFIFNKLFDREHCELFFNFLISSVIYEWRRVGEV